MMWCISRCRSCGMKWMTRNEPKRSSAYAVTCRRSATGGHHATSWLRLVLRGLICCRLEVLRGFQQTIDGSGTQFIKRGIIFALGDVTIARFCNLDFSRMLAVLRDYADADRRIRKARSGKAGCRQIAKVGNNRFDIRAVHLFPIRPPIIESASSLRQEVSLVGIV